MSLLNLNSPAGRGPGGKKSLKMFMGAGLLVAVLGIGSTLAANITLNSPEGTTEFGQGVTRAVYCGGDEVVTVSPISIYQNSVIGADTPEIPSVSFSAQYVTPYVTFLNSKNADTATTTTILGSTAGSVPRWESRSAKTGWWLASPTSTSVLSPQPTLSEVALNPSAYYFAEEYAPGKFYKAFSNSSYNTNKIIARDYVAAVDNPTIEGSFRMAGVSITNIPEECEYVDFVLSFFGETGKAQTMISGSGEVVKEVAYYWDGEYGGAQVGYIVSSDRTRFVPTTLVTAETTPYSLKFIFNTVSGTALSPSDLNKIIVETQENTFDY
jgi:hypothetical protein